MNDTEKKTVKIWDRKGFLAVVSVLCAIVLWFFVSINFGTVETRLIKDIPVDIDFTDITERYGLELINIIGPDEIKDKKVDVKIKGKKLAVNQIKSEDISVKAQASHITSSGSQVLSLKYECKSPRYDISFTADNPSDLFVFVDRVSEKEFDTVAVAVEGSVVTQEGYVAESPYSNVTSIKLKGPESVVSTIEKVSVRAKVDEMLSETATFSGKLVFLDRNGGEVVNDKITYDFRDKITVTVPVKISKQLKLAVKFKNVPEGYSEKMLKYTITPPSITVKGSPDAMTAAAFESDALVIGEVDFAKLTKQNNPLTFPINLSSGIELTEETADVTVKFDLSGIESKTMSLTKDNVRFSIVNNAANHTATVTTVSFKNVTVCGPSDQIRKLAESDFLVTIDLADKEAFVGSCVVNATITVPGKNKCWVVGTYEVEVSIQNAP